MVMFVFFKSFSFLGLWKATNPSGSSGVFWFLFGGFGISSRFEGLSDFQLFSCFIDVLQGECLVMICGHQTARVHSQTIHQVVCKNPRSRLALGQQAPQKPQVRLKKTIYFQGFQRVPCFLEVLKY